MPTIPDELMTLSHALGDPQRQYVIIGEGNTSLRVDDRSFWVKASGQQLATISAAGFAHVQFDRIMQLFETPPQTLTEERDLLRAARMDDSSAFPSVETSFHAMLLSDCGVNCIAHTHPIAINRLMCSQHAEAFARHRSFPDEVVLCGPESVYVPYVDPGLPLAQEIRIRVRQYVEKYGEAPKVILLANHGLIALGMTTTEALSVTDMCVKSAEILWGVLSVGAPVFLSEEEVMHIYRRPDEIYRRKMFAELLKASQP